MKFFHIAVIALVVASFAFFGAPSIPTPEENVREQLASEAGAFTAAVAVMLKAAANNDNETTLQRLFLQTRLAYKKLEWSAEYELPVISRSVNGPLVAETELSGQVIEPDGLQVIETMLYPHYTLLNKQHLTARLERLLENAGQYGDYCRNATFYNWRIFDAAKRRLFDKAFPRKNRQSIDTLEILNAISSYIRSRSALNSRFDRYMRGDDKAVSQSAVHGFNLFMGRARCATCHYMPLFNGTLPPKFAVMETEIIGVPQTKSGKIIDTDPGRFSVSPYPFNLHAFKQSVSAMLPGLRLTCIMVYIIPFVKSSIFTIRAEVPG